MRYRRSAFGLAAALALVAASAGGGERATEAASGKGAPAPVFPRTGIFRVQPRAGPHIVSLALRPGVRFSPAVAETVFWGLEDSTRDLSVRVTDPLGAALTGDGGLPVSLPVRFTISALPEGSSGARLVSDGQSDSAEIVVMTLADGTASAALLRGSGVGLYEVAASLPEDLADPADMDAAPVILCTITSGVPAGYVDFLAEQGHLADDVDSARVEVKALDFLGAPVDDAPLWAVLRPTDNGPAWPLRSIGDGRYEGAVRSHHAGALAVEVVDERTGIGAQTDIAFSELAPHEVRLLALGDMEKQGPWRRIPLAAVVIDDQGNYFDAAERQVDVTTSLGSLVPAAPDSSAPWAHRFDLAHAGLGNAQVIAEDRSTGLRDTLEVLFPAVSLGRGIDPVLAHRGPDAPTRFELPVRVYVPPQFVLQAANLTIQFPPELASFQSWEDADLQDRYATQVIPQGPGQILVVAQTHQPPFLNGQIDLAICGFDCEEPGMTSFVIADAVLWGYPAAGGEAGGGGGSSPILDLIPAVPVENVEVRQKDYTCKICLNVIYSDACKDKIQDLVDKAVKDLQDALNKGCCTILIEKPTLCEVKGLKGGNPSQWGTQGGEAQARVSDRQADIIRQTQDCRKDECLNIYILPGFSAPTGGIGSPIEQGEAIAPNEFDKDGNVKGRKITDSKGKPIKGKDGKELGNKSTQSAFVSCKNTIGGAINPERFSNVFIHEFGHMMGLDHSEKTTKKEDDDPSNAMHETGGEGKSFASFQCEWIMQNINGFCRPLQ